MHRQRTDFPALRQGLGQRVLHWQRRFGYENQLNPYGYLINNTCAAMQQALYLASQNDQAQEFEGTLSAPMVHAMVAVGFAV